MTSCPDCPHLDATRMPADWKPRPSCCCEGLGGAAKADVPGQVYPAVPPVRVSSNPDHADFHPSYARIGVALDGVRRPDVSWYDVAAGLVRAGRAGRQEKGQVVVWWLRPETRQQRRARERWERKVGYRAEPMPEPAAPEPDPVQSMEGGPLWVDPDAERAKVGTVSGVGLAAAAALALTLGGCSLEEGPTVPTPELRADADEYAQGRDYQLFLDQGTQLGLQCGIVAVEGEASRLFVHDGVQLVVQPVVLGDEITQADAIALGAFADLRRDCSQ